MADEARTGRHFLRTYRSSYFSLAGAHTAAEYRLAIIHLALFVFVALLICWFNAALRYAQESLRRSEINFRSLVTNAPYGICRCDSNGVLLSANPALVAMLGHSSASELQGRNLANLYPDSQQWFDLADYFRSLQRFNGLFAEWLRERRQHHPRARFRGAPFAAKTRLSSSNSSLRMSPSTARLSNSCARRRRWKPSAASPAASRTTSTTC